MIHKEKYIDLDGKELTRTTFGDGYIVDIVEYTNKHGQKHRLDGLAYINDNSYQAWYKDGKRHREDGPAIIWSDGTEAYYIEGKRVSKKEIDLLWLKKQVEE